MKKSTSPPRHIVHVSTCSAGGMLSVVQALKSSSLAEKWPLRIVCSHDEVSLPAKLRLAAKAYGLCLGWLLLRRVALFHLHVAERGSLFRKSLILLLARLFRVPVIFHMHGAEFDAFYAACPARVQAYVRWVLDGCDRIVALCERWGAYYQTLTTTPVQVIPNFVPSPHPGFTEHGTPPGRLEVLYLGRFGERKGIYDLIEALRPLFDRYPGLSVNCGGDGDSATVSHRLADYGMSERFRILGWLEPSERDRLLERADLFVLPSHAEGLPMAILEAMEASLCIVATRVGGIPEEIEEGVTGFLVEPHDVEGLRAVFERLIENPPLRIQVGRNARTLYLQKFSAEALIPRFDALYQELTGL